MTDTMSHRGPDDSGVWVDAKKKVALGHRRLSIQDLSKLGAQPMHSACGRFTLCYNGEVYNHFNIRQNLSGYPFKSSSDTETILAAVSRWGLEKAVKKMVGMFAFALWDEQERTVSLVRDRLGVKPLFYGKVGNDLVFGSELKAIRKYSGFDSIIDRNALSLYFRHNYIPAPYSVYQGIKKMEPGTIVTFDDSCELVRTSTFWSAKDVWMEGVESPFSASADEVADELEKLLSKAISGRMLSDVPLGAFLSGGIDSSIVAAIMQAQSSQPIRTFSIGFHNAKYNEAEHAKAVATYLGTNHTELYVTPSDLLDVVPSIPALWDEPFGDSSQIPTYILSKLTRKHVTVALSGDGGDELFSGYQRYFSMDKWEIISKIPKSVRSVAGSGVRRLPSNSFDFLGGLGPKIRWRLDILGMSQFSEFYRYFMSHFKHPNEFVLGSKEPATHLTRDENNITDDRFSQMAFWDIIGYLPDDILTKVDRASMGAGLEARVPLLDHNVVEFAAKIPTSMKVHGVRGKIPLRNVLSRYVPDSLIDRPKMGFGVPIGQWMREDLREWCEDLLSPAALRKQGYIDEKFVGKIWKSYVGGNDAWQYYLWDILMFQSWLEEYGG